ncbi:MULTISPECIES: telomere-protecting terminal protein Tpg [unclassified Streptomyces]|uniref:telomere-protecting terminal protein Tpg n=1 Tax=unclassified Streptomyces TaxID=2593676 RepID=UPI003653B7CA
MVNSLGDSLDLALEKAFTRPAPKSAQAQMKYLVKQLKGTKAAAASLGVSQRTVERYVKGQIKRPRHDLAARIEREVRKRWQPQLRAKAKKKAASTDGIVLTTTARFGYTADDNTTDDARVRALPSQALPPQYAEALFNARENGASEQDLLKIAAEALGQVYFRDGGRRAQGLKVEFTDVQDIRVDL